jgi:xylulokinase
MAIVLGLDSSTQSLSALLLDTGAGTVLADESVNFGNDLPEYQAPSGFIPGGANGQVHADPRMWLDALDMVFAKLVAGGAPLDRVEAISVSGQQHGTVYLGESFAATLAGLKTSDSLAKQLAPVLTRASAPIWMDTSTGRECREIAAAAGGNDEVCARSGSVAVERFSGPQIRRFFATDPDAYARTAVVHLVSSFIASVVAGRSVPIDYGDGAGMNLMNLASLDWDPVLLEATAPGLHEKLPPLAASATVAGEVAGYLAAKYGVAKSAVVVIGTGDNPSSLVGMGATAPGQVVISLGTSDTMFAAMPGPKTDPAGYGHVFGNPAGGYMSLICFRNGSLAREALRDQHHLSWEDFDRKALSATPPGNNGRHMLPFYGPEITPRLDLETPVLVGDDEFTAANDKPALVRAMLEGQFLNMRLHSRWMGVKTERILLTGGASRNNGIARTVADIFQAPVERLAVANSAALGAALRAAAALGADLEELYLEFCKPDAGSRIDPDPAAAAAYDDALARFEATLAKFVG